MPTLIAICGGSCSGKTTLSRHLQSRLGEDKCLHLRQDDYYYDIRKFTFDGPLPNFDHPSTVDFDRLAEDLIALKNNQAIIPPKYDFKIHHRVDPGLTVDPKPFVIVEGLLLLSNPRVRALFDYRHYIECDEDLRRARRLKRDQTERSRPKDEILWQLDTHVFPCHNEFITPSKSHADHVIRQADYLADIDDLCQRMIAKWPAA